MTRDEWTQALLITGTIALVTVGVIWMLVPGIGDDWDEPGDMIPRRTAPAQVTLWAGEIQPGLKGVLVAVYGDPEPDAEHDRKLNAALDRQAGAELGFYRLLLFNTSSEDKQFSLADGALVVQAAAGTSVGLQNLSDGVAAGRIEVSPAVRATLGMLGTLSAEVDVPPGKRVNLIVAFRGHTDLATAESVATAEGHAFHRLQRSRAELRRIIADPRADRIRDL